MRTLRSLAPRPARAARHGKAITAAVSLLVLGACMLPKSVPAATPLSVRLAAATRVAKQRHGNGYWLVSADGTVTAFGGASLYGSMKGQPLAAPIVGIVATDDGRGYWLY